MKELSIYTRYDTLGASSRYRYFMYEKYLRGGGFDPKYYYFYDNHYLSELYRGGRSLASYPRAFGRRFKDAARISDISIIEYELFPFLPWAVDRHYLRKTKYVVNFDDNVWEKYAQIPFLNTKFNKIIANAAGVITANNFLHNRITELNSNVIKIPTVPDVADYSQELPKFERFTIVWIGTPVTYGYLEKFADTLRKMNKVVDFEMIVIASSELKPIEGVNMRCLDWSPEIESKMLCRSHVGIMPLTDDAMAHGKSAFKIIQYLVAGLPVIASPIGENVHVISPGATGFLPESPEQWCEAVEALAKNSYQYRDMCANARETGKQYSLDHWAPVLLKFLYKSYT